MEIKDWAKIQEELLKAQLGVIRGYLKNEDSTEHERKVSRGRSKSQMSMIIDVLESTKTPLHISEIIGRVEEQYGVKLDRESVVSALTKKIKKGATFVRTSPNTFGLKEQQR